MYNDTNVADDSLLGLEVSANQIKEDDSVAADIAAKNETRNLEDLLGKEIQVTAFFVRFGLTCANDSEEDNITILLKMPYTFYGGEFRRIASHCWIKHNEAFKKCKLRHGDKVTFTATVSRYQKRSGVWNYTFSDVSSAVVLQRNPTPARLGIFEFQVSLSKNKVGFVALKGRPKTLFQKRLNVQGQTFYPSNEDPPIFEFKLRDITRNGIFRFYYKLPGQSQWFKYALFFPSKGQKIFFVSGNYISRIYIDSQTYYTLKDAYAQFAYSGEYKFPIKPYKINEMAQKDLDPNLVDGHWPSKRSLVRLC